MNKFLRNVGFYLLIILIAISVIDYFSTRSTTKQEINYTEFLQQVDKGEVSKVTIVDNVIKGNLDAVIHYENHEHAAYAVPTPEHYLPLLYCLGAAGTDKATPFNNTCTLGSMAMTGFVWA